MRPSSTSTTRSASATASCTSCVTSSAVKPCSRHRRSISWCISMRVSASSAPSGSSSSSSRGCAPAPGPATRAGAGRRTGAPASRRCGRPGRPAPAPRPRPACDGGRPSVTLSITRRQGSRRASWNMMRVSARAGRHVLPVERHAAGGGGSRPGHQPQQRALAAAAAAHDGDELAGLDDEFGVAQHVWRAEALGQAAQSMRVPSTGSWTLMGPVVMFIPQAAW
jgi:hypothetical protein